MAVTGNTLSDDLQSEVMRAAFWHHSRWYGWFQLQMFDIALVIALVEDEADEKILKETLPNGGNYEYSTDREKLNCLLGDTDFIIELNAFIWSCSCKKWWIWIGSK